MDATKLRSPELVPGDLLHPVEPSSLVEVCHKCAVPERSLKRCFHRVMSGLEKGGQLRFITLTSAEVQPRPIQESLRRLIWRLRRRGVLLDYIRVIEYTKRGREHVHMIYRGSFIDQKLLSVMWNDIHGAPVVDIRQVRRHRGGLKGVARELAKYMAKDGHRRYSWSWGWVYKGFVKTWMEAKRMCYQIERFSHREFPYYSIYRLWYAHMRGRTSPREFLAYLCFEWERNTHLPITYCPGIKFAWLDAVSA
ncbi:hypothetical protein ES705_10890 [subsurface metagenome]